RRKVCYSPPLAVMLTAVSAEDYRWRCRHQPVRPFIQVAATDRPRVALPQTCVQCFMVDRNLIREFSVDETELDQTFGQSLLEVAPSEDEMDLVYDATSRSFEPNTIVDGYVLSVNGDEVLIDIGYKSEGVVTIDEWDEDEEKPDIGETNQVMLQTCSVMCGMTWPSKYTPT